MRKMWKVIYPSKIEQQNNHFKMKEILRRQFGCYSYETHTVNQGKYSISKESNTFSHGIPFASREIDIKSKAIDAAQK